MRTLYLINFLLSWLLQKSHCSAKQTAAVGINSDSEVHENTMNCCVLQTGLIGAVSVENSVEILYCPLMILNAVFSFNVFC